MDFTREPIIETVITPKEGHKLVIRNSKAVGQEEFFVDAVEIISFGQALFFRSVEKPKAFIVPTHDYEVLEVREARMVLKHVGLERAIKIGGGKESLPQRHREPVEREAPPLPPPIAVSAEAAIAPPADAPLSDEKNEGRFERKRERRRHYRRRRDREDPAAREADGWSEGDAENEEEAGLAEEEQLEVTLPTAPQQESSSRDPVALSSSILSSLLPPPPNLISETIARYRENDMFKDAFFLKENSADTQKTETPLPSRHAEAASTVEPAISEELSNYQLPHVAAEETYVPPSSTAAAEEWQHQQPFVVEHMQPSAPATEEVIHPHQPSIAEKTQHLVSSTSEEIQRLVSSTAEEIQHLVTSTAEEKHHVTQQEPPLEKPPATHWQAQAEPPPFSSLVHEGEQVLPESMQEHPDVDEGGTSPTAPYAP